jgi:hypothetical protein
MQAVNKNRVLKNLNTIAESLTARGVYVVNHTQTSIDILEYISGNCVLKNLPNKQVADSVCHSLNTRRHPQTHIHHLRVLLNQYNKLSNDVQFYQYTISHTDSAVKKDTAVARLDITVCKLKDVLKQLRKLS